MKVFVMSAEYVKGVSKKTNNPYEAVVTDFIYEENGVKKVKSEWVNPNLLNGVVPQYGDVWEFQYGIRGYLTSAKPILTEKCKLVIYSVGANVN
jgi:hypothetical protein